MKTKLVLGVILLTTSVTALSSCNAVSFAIKSKGDEITASEWAEKYVQSYEENLGDFNDGIFSNYSLEGEKALKTSFTLKYRKQDTLKKTTKSIEEKNTLKSSKNEKDNATIIYDIDNNTYKKTITGSQTTKSPNGNNYSDHEQSSQYQKYQNKVYSFDLVNKTYSENAVTSVSLAALNDSYLAGFYMNIYSMYLAAYEPLLFPIQFKNGDYKFYAKGNVFTITLTEDYENTISKTLGYTDIEGTIVYTLQYILEKSYITYTTFANYKNCSWTGASGKYKYKLEEETGETYTMKLKGSVSKVYTEDFTFKS
ncbi:MAG: hypothetical protein MJ248_04410 [Bacilli bacterium]|nr:hypothetical protein [Bacilli bacterium]